MHIQSLEIANVLGARRVSISTDRAAVLVAGYNGAGKSSIAEAVRFAVLGEAPRGSGLKKDYPRLVSDGSSTGSAVVAFDGPSFAATLPAGKREGADLPARGVEFCFAPERFAALEPKERRAFLFGLMGVGVKAADIKERLEKRGVDAKKAAEVAPLLVAGFDSAAKEAAGKARDAKASWRTITGETYGSEKAKTWAAAALPFDAADAAAIPRVELDVVSFDEKIEAANRELGAMEAEARAVESANSRLEAARAKVATIERIEKKLETDRAELASWETKVSEAEAAAAGKNPGVECDCPECGVSLVYAGGKLEVWTQDAEGDESLAAKLPEYRKARDLLRSAVSNAERDLAAANAAKATVDEIEAAIGEAPSDEEVAAARRKVAELKAERKTSVDYLESLRNAKRAAAEAEGKTTRAALYAADVVAWETIAEALSPNGIPSELLADAIGPFNDAAKRLAETAGWEAPALDGEMAISVGGRPYGLRSESEKWRADAILAATIASIGGAGFVMLDRLDVLDAAGRTDALYFLSDLAGLGIGSLAFATLKAIPNGLEELGIAGFWIDKGVVGAKAEEGVAA